ncbi:MAG: putative Ig domain-containing protein [Gammaproteobacteria bacterium]|nr:putative Ig domain-containing protein [Gammaproteobacteria bacterium]
MTAPKIADVKSLIAIKGFEITPIRFKNSGDAVTQVSIDPALPLGLQLSIENNTCVLTGSPMTLSAREVYTITAGNGDGSNKVTFEITVTEAPIKAQREEIIRVHDQRHDLDTPRSQVENAMNDGAMMQSHIKPHEKFLQQPTGDDKRLSQQTANNPEAEANAAARPELTPSPSAQLQAQAVNRAQPSAPTPSPLPGK